MIVLLFGYIFHVTLYTTPAFKSVPQAMVKTIVWLLGDLSYDGTFVSRKNYYPWLTNCIFVVFATSVAAFIANLLVSNPMRYIEEYTKTAELNKYRLCVDIFLEFDLCFPRIRRHFIKEKLRYNKKSNDSIDKVQMAFALVTDDSSENRKASDLEERLAKLEDMINLQNDLILQILKDKDS